MWEEVKNKTDFSWSRGNSSQVVPKELPWGPITTAHSNGSIASSRPSHTDPGSVRGSGIIPGAIAAAVFISLLLGLYAVLWKCMLTTPKRKEKKKRTRGFEQRLMVC